MQGDKISAKQIIRKFERLSVSSSSSTSLAQTAIKIRDAVHYIECIKERFLEDESEVYDEFLLLMDEFKNHSSVIHRLPTDPYTKLSLCSINTTDVINRIKRLFYEHPDLVAGFDYFLPPGYSTSSSAAETTGDEEADEDSDGSRTASPGEGSRSTTPTPGDIRKRDIGEKLSGESTIAYIQRVKHQCDSETWEQFMVILSRQYDDQSPLDAEEMIKDVEELFEDHPELIPGFRTFLTEEKQEKDSKSSGKRRSET